MKQDIKLYIDNRQVDLVDNISLPFVYQLKDMSNPTIVKNNFSKTIDIIGTPNNNAIFGQIYKFDREQILSDGGILGAYFNPSQRTPFTIYKNNEIMEEGYIQLNAITKQNDSIRYSVTFFGGIGNFFYSLTTKENGEKLTLSDLVYNVEDDNGNLITDGTELDFTINADFIKKNWDSLGTEGNSIHNFISFIPSYNGLPQNFDADKVLINTYNNDTFNQVTDELFYNDNGTIYETYNNYVLAQLPKKYTEWEVKDLRSYLQKPSLSVKKFFETISNPVNNGNYQVILDEDFFNDDRAEYSKSYIALPLLSNKEKEGSGNVTTNANVNVLPVGGNLKVETSYGNIIPVNNFVVNNGVIDYTNVKGGTLTNVDLTFGVDFIADDIPLSDKLYLSTDLKSAVFDRYNKLYYEYIPHKSAINIQIVATDAETDKVVGYSDVISLSNVTENNNISVNENNADVRWRNYVPTSRNERIKTNLGSFVKSDGLLYRWENDDKSQMFNLRLENIPYTKKLKLSVKFARMLDNTQANLFQANTASISKAVMTTNSSRFASGEFNIRIDDIQVSRVESVSDVASNTLITKDKLLKTEYTPADYLLSYTKMFNLFFTIDEKEKKISILTMKNYFRDNIINLDKKIDYSKEMKIKPIIFDKKFYTMNNEGDSYYLTKYKNEYAINYGQKRINTNYNFNADTEELFKDNVYKNNVSVLDTSSYFHTFINRNGDYVAPFQTANFTYKLFNVLSGKISTKEMDSITKAVIGGTKWNVSDGYDVFPKPCFFNGNEEKELADVSSTLLFYNGKKALVDENGNDLKYKITDDVQEMFLLNNNTPCWLYTTEDKTESNKKISISITELPMFGRYIIENNYVTNSFDFGLPKEIYIPNVTYTENQTLFEKYWKNYYTEMLNINTKQVECYVNLDGIMVNNSALRNFYYFGGCYWILNKIDNYDVNKIGSTKCIFIKVNDINNYR